jgi:hypothetical protein
VFCRILRIVGIVLLGVTAVITLLSGMGTTCVALDATRYDGMESIAGYRWLYLFYVAAGIVIGVLGIRGTVALVRSRPSSYRAALVALLLGLATGGLHMATSRALRGNSMPTDFIVYATLLTLAVFLLFRLPRIWNGLNLAGKDEGQSGLGTGVALMVSAITVLTVQLWAGPSHSMGGVNYADAWHQAMALVGWTMGVAGSGFLARHIISQPLVPRTSPAALKS